jgi:TolB protein
MRWGSSGVALSVSSNLEIYLMGSAGSVRLTNNTARDLDPVLSPDGSKIAFVSDRDGGSAGIYVMKSDGTSAFRLTSQGDIEPAWSPDGSKIVFASYRVDYNAGKTELTTDLWQMNADGTGQTQLTFRNDGDPGSTAPSYSPDGSRIVFILGWQIWSIAADGSDPTPLSTVEDNFSASYSPDGSSILFSSDRQSTFADVWVMNADGTSPTRLTTTNSGAGTPTFSPDGSRIAFGRGQNGNEDIYLINADGTGETRLTADPAQDFEPKFGP